MAVTSKKILLKVEKDNRFVWVHFCYIPSDLYVQFFRATGIDKSEFGSYLSKWAKADFGVKLSMSRYKDIETLKELVNTHFTQAYSELYSQRVGIVPEIKGWMRLWVSQNIMMELSSYE